MSIFAGVIAGVLSTFAMDFFAIQMMKRRMFDLQGLQIVPTLLGRWTLNILSSRRFFVQDIRSLPPHANEVRFGFFLHYLIGATLGGAFPVLLGGLHWSSPLQIVVLGMLYGLLTNALPWGLMYPSMGFGFCASQLTAKGQILKFSLINHLVYGTTLGLLFLALLKTSSLFL